MKLPDRFALKLSKENIHLLVQSPDGCQRIIGTSDPNKPTLTNDLKRLLDQLKALTDDYPVVDVLLPNDLVLCQRVKVDEPFSQSSATDFIGEKCDLEKHEVMVAISTVSNENNQTIAAVTSKTITETRIFLKNAGFYTQHFMAASPVSGFKKAPIFASDKVPWNRNTIKKTATATAWTVAAGFLIALFQIFSNTYLVTPSAKILDNPEIAQFEYQTPSKYSPSNLNKKPLYHIEAPEITQLKPLSKVTTSNPKKHSSLNFLTDQSVTTSSKPVEVKGRYLERSASIETEARLGYVEAKYNESYARKMSHITSPAGNSILYLYLTPKLKMQLLTTSIGSLSPLPEERVSRSEVVSLKGEFSRIQTPSVKNNHLTDFVPSSERPMHSNLDWLMRDSTLTKNQNLDLTPLARFFHNDYRLESQLKDKPILKVKVFEYSQTIETGQYYETIAAIDPYELTEKERLLSKKYKPNERPKIIAAIKLLAEPTLSSGAITYSEFPMVRPLNVIELARLEPNSISISAKATKRPTFPRRASVESNATINNILELNRTNLIGVFGTELNAVALIRLSSGRVIKVKVGDRFQGWQVLTIHKDKIDLANGAKLETLRLPG
ncbi:MAG: hypothetical protein VYE27_03500 [Pseudomonadota bacterium]|nr:hypothetical protein [Pseudomonadota bacterium]